jgi:pSer/pThr/pTyr-binding forkhead associated (FHA) protein
VIGRNPSCDYAIHDVTVSGRHAELARTRDGWRIKDLSSRNGTRVNGWLVRDQDLLPGDTIELGAALFVFRPPVLPGH